MSSNCYLLGILIDLVRCYSNNWSVLLIIHLVLQWGAGLMEIGQIGYLAEIRILAKFGKFIDNFGL